MYISKYNKILDSILSAKKLTGGFLQKLKEDNPEIINSIKNCGNEGLSKGFSLYNIILKDKSNVRCVCKDF